MDILIKITFPEGTTLASAKNYIADIADDANNNYTISVIIGENELKEICKNKIQS